jgi:hypothetical protein
LPYHFFPDRNEEVRAKIKGYHDAKTNQFYFVFPNQKKESKII